jgi:hypothetical protein
LRKSPYTESTSGGGASTSYHGDSDLQLKRINVYCNEATDELLEKPLYRKHFWRRRLRFVDKVAKVVVRSSGRALGADKSGNETGGLGGAKVGTEPEELKWEHRQREFMCTHPDFLPHRPPERMNSSFEANSGAVKRVGRSDADATGH